MGNPNFRRGGIFGVFGRGFRVKLRGAEVALDAFCRGASSGWLSAVLPTPAFGITEPEVGRRSRPVFAGGCVGSPDTGA